MASAGAHNVTGSAIQLAKNRSDRILAYPEGEFEVGDLPDELQRELPELQAQGIALVVDHFLDAANKQRNIYRIASRAREAAREAVDNRDPYCPCGHAGFRNCGDHYECVFDLCEREFARDELEVDG